MKKNYKLTIAYDGSRYYGWEHQPDKDTIQGRLENVVEKMTGEFTDVIGAGRTDAGVHARAMTAHMKADLAMDCTQIRDYMNRYLPADIAVTHVTEASERFHARYNAVGKTYRYTCFAGAVKPVFDRKYVTILEERPDVEAMKRAAAWLVGEMDYRSFCANPRMKKSTVRKVDTLEITEKGGYIRFTVHGTGFLQNMVRILVGTLLEVGYGRMQPEDIPRIQQALDRRLAGPTAPPQGLMLIQVDY